jgi:hypothetical protein
MPIASRDRTVGITGPTDIPRVDTLVTPCTGITGVAIDEYIVCVTGRAICHADWVEHWAEVAHKVAQADLALSQDVIV